MATYYERDDFKKFSGNGLGSLNPETWEKFMGFYGAANGEGKLTAREKALIGLGAAAALECAYCIDAYTNKLINMGLDGDAIMEVFYMAAAIHSGACMAHGLQALNYIEDAEF